jgi:hypothetical protein
MVNTVVGGDVGQHDQRLVVPGRVGERAPDVVLRAPVVVGQNGVEAELFGLPGDPDDIGVSRERDREGHALHAVGHANAEVHDQCQALRGGVALNAIELR